MSDEPKYKNLPVDLDTDEKIAILCRYYGFPKRSKGAMVRKLVNAEFEKPELAKLLAKGGKKSESKEQEGA